MFRSARFPQYELNTATKSLVQVYSVFNLLFTSIEQV